MHHFSVRTTALAALLIVATNGHGQARSTAEAESVTDVVTPDASPIFGVTIPPGYRQWELVAPSQETGRLDELRAIVGNAIAMHAYKEGTLPFPDGSVLAKLAWKHVPASEFEGAFVPGAATTVQFMVKDSKKYASTGGWGFGRFIDGKHADEAQHRSCFACHQAKSKEHDIVFTRLAR